jgi:hypothetical protein
VGLAEHLAVVDVAVAAFAPGGDVVGIHIFEGPELLFGGEYSGKRGANQAHSIAGGERDKKTPLPSTP